LSSFWTTNRLIIEAVAVVVVVVVVVVEFSFAKDIARA
jgi:hypothetical protein